MAVFSGQVGDRCKQIRVKRKTTMDRPQKHREGQGRGRPAPLSSA